MDKPARHHRKYFGMGKALIVAVFQDEYVSNLEDGLVVFAASDVLMKAVGIRAKSDEEMVLFFGEVQQKMLR